METRTVENFAPDVADRIWRAYAPFQRGRDTSGELSAMLAILVLARFVRSVDEPNSEFATRWARAVNEAQRGTSPVTDLRAALRSASKHSGFPLPNIRDLGVGFLGKEETPSDAPWAASFLSALESQPAPTEADFPDVCELFIERHIQESTFTAGEFYTPRTLARLLVELASPKPQDRILDPACGAGGVIAAIVQRFAEAGPLDGASLEAYAADRSNKPLAMLNLALHGVDRPVVRSSHPVSLLQSQGNDRVDRVMSNPPFSQRLEDVSVANWPFGQPPKSSASFAWLQLAWSRLSEDGTAAMIMPPRASWSGGREAEIREAMIDGGAPLSIIALPPNLFAHTSISVHLWIVARDKSRQLPSGDANEILFIDASQLGTQEPRQPLLLTTEDRERISGRFHSWLRSPRGTPADPGFARSVTHKEILEKGGSLDPRLYVEQERPKTTADIGGMLAEMDRYDVATGSSSTRLRESFNTSERRASSTSTPPRVMLGDAVKGTVAGEHQASTPGLLLAGPSGSLIQAEHYVDVDGVPVVMPKDLTGTGFSESSIKYIAKQRAEDLKRFRLQRDDVVLARRGELGRCAVVRQEQQGWVCGTGCFVLRPSDALDPDYLSAFLRSLEARTWLAAHSTGSVAMKTISLKTLYELPVILPDLETQQAIGRMMRQLDERERLLHEQLSLTEKIRRDAIGGLLENP